MQGSRLPLDDDTAESRLPVSTLRSTASPYKRAQFTASTNQYTAFWTQVDQNRFKHDLQIRTSNIHSLLTTPLPVASKQSDVDRDEGAIRPAVLDPSSPQRDSISEISETDAFDASSNAPSSPLVVPGSPSSSVAADISGAFDILHDLEDDLTESDHSPFERVPTIYSPFSSPLSSIADAVAEREGTPCPSVPPTKPPRQSLSSTHSSTEARSEDGATMSRRKRPRTPSPQRKPALSRGKERKQKSELHAQSSGERKRGRRKSPGRSPDQAQLSPRSLEAVTDLIGPLVQILALSGRSSMPTSTVIHELFLTTPSFKSERTLEEWTTLVVFIMSSHSVFGQAERAGLKNADDENVEDEWFYRPENDEDLERRETLGAFQRGGGKRRATMEKKQYFWKPVR